MTPRDGDPTDDPRAGEGEARRASETPARYAPLRVPIDGPDDSRAPGAGNSFAPGPAGDDDVEILVEVADDVSREELEWLESTTEPRFDLLSTSPPPTPPAASEPARPTEDVAAPPSVAPLAPTAGPAEEYLAQQLATTDPSAWTDDFGVQFSLLGMTDTHNRLRILHGRREVTVSRLAMIDSWSLSGLDHYSQELVRHSRDVVAGELAWLDSVIAAEQSGIQQGE